MKTRIKYKALAPVSHIGEVASTGSYFQTVLTAGGKVPAITGNSIRGQIRDSIEIKEDDSSKCYSEIESIPATGHKNVTKTDAVSATCTIDGNIEYWYCEVCNKYFSDEKAEHEITLEDTIIAKLPKFVSGANQEWTKGSKDG